MDANLHLAKRPNRQSLRLPSYDYSSPGAYFVTIAAQNHECIFGSIENNELSLNDAGRMVARWYQELEHKFSGVRCDAFVCMPNHVHFVLENTDTPLHSIVQWYKTMTTNEYIRGVKSAGWRAFDRRLWQRNYWEHVVRSEVDMSRIREYIQNNPAQWALDRLFVPER